VSVLNPSLPVADQPQVKTRLALVAILLTLGLAAPAARAADLAVLPPRAPADLEVVARGATEWVRARFAEAGLASRDAFSLAAALAPDRSRALPSREALRELRGQGGAERAWLLDLDTDRGNAVLQLVLVDLGSGSTAAAGHAEAKLANLGGAVAEVTDAVIAQAGSAGRTLSSPSLAELDRYGRAVVALDEGHLADAWRALGNKLTPASQSLRSRLEAAGSSEQVPLAERTRLAVARGDSARARLWLRSQMADNQDDALLALAAAEAAEEIGEFERALSLFDRVIELDPDSRVARAGRARMLLEAGRNDEGVAALSALESHDTALLETAVELPNLDPSVQAKLHWRLAAQLEARFESERAVEHLERAARLDTSLEGVTSRDAALLHTRLGESERALAPAERAAQLGAADAPLLEALGVARHRAGDTHGARAAFEQARALAPRAPGPLIGLGQIAIESGDTAAADVLLKQALEVAPHHTQTRLALAGAMRANGQVDGALAVLEGHPGGPNADLLRETASIRAAQGDLAGARGMLEEAMELAPANVTLTEELAKLREAGGDAAGAESLRKMAERMGGGASSAASELGASNAASTGDPGTLNELAASFPQRIAGRDAPVQVVALLPMSLADETRLVSRLFAPKRLAPDALGHELARALATRFEVVAPHEIPAELATAEQQTLRAFDDGEATVARMNDALGTDAVFVARLRGNGDADKRPGALHVEVRMLAGSDPMHVRRFGNQTWIADGERHFSEWNPVAILVYSLLLVIAVLPLIRGWGELQVGIQYASLGKGFFSIKLSRRAQRADLGEGRKQGKGRYLRKMRLMGRYERSMVGRETLFRWLPARGYYVTVHGLLQDSVTGEVIGNYAAEQKVVVRRGHPARLDFDFRSKECALEVCIFGGGEPVAQAVVAVRGLADSMRYARSGRTLFYLSPGHYKVLVGCGDRVLEREVSIETLAPRTLSFDRDDENAQLFTNCPEAVEPYLQGNLAGAADALERAGEETAAARIRGEHFAAIGDNEKAAQAFQRAGRFEQAATLISDSADPLAAATLYEQAGNHEKAAQAFRAAGNPTRAAHHYESVYRYEDAIECYREAGDVEKVCGLLEKLAHFFEAARCAMENGDPDRAIRCLQMIEMRDHEYMAACRLLGEIFTQRGELDLAVQKLDEAVTVGGGENAPLEVVEQLARTLEQAGRLDAAAETWESIRSRDFHYPDAATKVESLRKMIEEERASHATLATGGQPAESRYEILGEIGRGGMGVVLKARDKRLGRVVALKRLPDNLRNHPTAVRLFLREARAAAALNHRNIVTLFDAGQEGDQYFLTMELLEGFPLHDVLEKRGKLSPRDAARLGAQTAAGLEYAHAQGVVHRDIKTSNLFFTKDRVLKIMDFGLAKMTEEVRRAATVVGGTPYYMAPEQAAGEDVDHRADQYALGVTLYELVTGDVPFRDGDVTYHHRHTPAPDPRKAARDLPEDFAAVIAKLLAKRPEDRFASTGEAGAQLARISKRLAA
jgi:tetratricopeptide (TPR) repeat protein